MAGPELLGAISRTLELTTYDAAYVENLLLAERRRRQPPTPTLPRADEARIDRGDRIGARRSFRLRPVLQFHRRGLSWHDEMTICRHGSTAIWQS